MLTFVEDYVEKHSDFPTMRRIQKEFGYSSPNTAAMHVKALVNKGYLIRYAGGHYDFEAAQYYLTSRARDELENLFKGMLDLWLRGATLMEGTAREYRENFYEILDR